MQKQFTALGLQKQFTAFADFLKVRKHFQNRVPVEVAFIDLCGGDHLAAIMLTILLDAMTPFGEWAPAIQYVEVSWSQWWKRARIPERTGRRTLRHLTSLGYVEVTRSGKTTGSAVRYRVREKELLEAWNALLAGEAPVFPLKG